MKILKKGKPPGDREHTATCTGCGCKFRFKKSEAKFVGDQREGDYYQVKCPETACPYSVTIAASLLR